VFFLTLPVSAISIASFYSASQTQMILLLLLFREIIMSADTERLIQSNTFGFAKRHKVDRLRNRMYNA
jgi:hypothetical protein